MAAAVNSSSSSSSSSSPAKNAGAPAAVAKYCLCAPTTHPGSFRCRLHRSPAATAKAKAAIVPPPATEEEEEEGEEMAAARAFLARASRKSRQDGGRNRIKCFHPRTSRLGIIEE
ncbi:hypothetical protein OsI_06122 [Oryza sativa Indica Group]|uniref:Uncharacterized protein n=3 Tax=Oryza TaxID=4527 RepID=A0A0E0NAU4_ORYRU|nr:hypothetical protein OsI_06122 [Oryza sativa Indica Group]